MISRNLSGTATSDAWWRAARWRERRGSRITTPRAGAWRRPNLSGSPRLPARLFRGSPRDAEVRNCLTDGGDRVVGRPAGKRQPMKGPTIPEQITGGGCRADLVIVSVISAQAPVRRTSALTRNEARVAVTPPGTHQTPELTHTDPETLRGLAPTQPAFHRLGTTKERSRSNPLISGTPSAICPPLRATLKRALSNVGRRGHFYAGLTIGIEYLARAFRWMITFDVHPSGGVGKPRHP
jgi:hypothetical protein